MAADVRIDIAAQFVGKKAFKDADTATDKLTKNVKGLAKGLLAVYSAQKLISFGKASVKAFAEDDKAAKALGTTLKNLGLAYGANVGTVNGFISRLEMQTGVLDDELRPAMDRLLRATGDVAKSQELLNLALDIAAGTGKSVTQVSQSLQKAYLGQTQALGRLGVGLSRAELTTSSFEEIQARLATLFAGQATAAADTYAGSLAKLTIAGNNAKETIGKGLVDALKAATGSSTVDPVVKGIDAIANAIANLARETGDFIAITRENFNLKDLSFFYKDPKAFKGLGNISMTVSSQDTQKADAIAKKNATNITKLTKEQAAAQAKILKDKRLQNTIDKANLTLNKGSDVFDMDKIQIAAALTNQAEQLGRVTTSSQALQIANDTARLNVKRSILAVEDAIAAKDEAAINAALKRLNADLGILGALNDQKITIGEIDRLIKSLQATQLKGSIEYTDNITEALTKIKSLQATDLKGSILYTDNITETLSKVTSLYSYQISAENQLTALRLKNIHDIANAENNTLDRKLRGYSASALALESLAGAERQAAIAKLASEVGTASLIQGIQSGMTPAQAAVGARYAAQAAYNYYIEITTGIGDPNAIAEAVDNVLRSARDRGTLTII